MPQVDVSINGQTYRIACDEGQQDHLRRLAATVDRRIAELVSVMGQIGELRLLVMVSMLMADELAQLEEDVAGLRAREKAASDETARANALLATGIEALAERIEAVAARLEQA